MVITDTNKAKEILLDVGYYRLGFYTYPFELYPSPLKFQRHNFVEVSMLLAFITSSSCGLFDGFRTTYPPLLPVIAAVASSIAF